MDLQGLDNEWLIVINKIQVEINGGNSCKVYEIQSRFNIVNKGMGHCNINYTGPQSLISHSLA